MPNTKDTITVKSVIKELGVQNVSAITHVSVRAVYKWMARDALPRTDYTGETDYAGAMSQLSNGKYSAVDIRDSGKPH